jgi:hypothetical protein
MSELEVIKSAEDAAIWARRILSAKNALKSADARQIEDAFQAKLSLVDGATAEPDGYVTSGSNEEQAQWQPARIDKATASSGAAPHS